MRISALIAKLEDRAIAQTPVVKAKAQQVTTTSRVALSTWLTKAASKVAPKPEVQG